MITLENYLIQTQAETLRRLQEIKRNLETEISYAQHAKLIARKLADRKGKRS